MDHVDSGAIQGPASPPLLIVHTDASYSRNGHRARCAFIVQVDDHVLHQQSRPVAGCSSSTTAEFAAMCASLTWLGSRPWPAGTTIVLRCDDQSVMDSLETGAIRSPGMVAIHRRTEELAEGLRSRGYELIFQWVPREHNLTADALSLQGAPWLTLSHRGRRRRRRR
jgi:hypothetical protein